MSLFFSLSIKLFVVFTPFFALTMFLALTEHHSAVQKRNTALFASLSIALISFMLLVVGNQLFVLFGITIDSFRVGAGILLMLSAINLVLGKRTQPQTKSTIAVVPLAIPITVGPAATGTLLVLGAELTTPQEHAIGYFALLTAVVLVGCILLAGSFIQRLVGADGITTLSKVTGLILSALAAQMILTGIRDFFGL